MNLPRGQHPSAAAEGDSLPCTSGDSDLWFSLRPEDLDFAKHLCQRCPIVHACLESARRRAEPWGVWGGEIFQDGVVVPRKRTAGRPRKDTRPAA